MLTYTETIGKIKKERRTRRTRPKNKGNTKSLTNRSTDLGELARLRQKLKEKIMKELRLSPQNKKDYK